jgi:hypothetical protein
MQIDFDEHPRKTDSSICFNCDPDSNSNVPIVADSKLDFPRLSTKRGMQMDVNDEPEKQDTSIRVRREFGSNVSSSIDAFENAE